MVEIILDQSFFLIKVKFYHYSYKPNELNVYSLTKWTAFVNSSFKADPHTTEGWPGNLQCYAEPSEIGNPQSRGCRASNIFKVI